MDQNDSYYHPMTMIYQRKIRKEKKKRVGKIERIARSMPAPSTEQTFKYCSACNCCRHLRFQKTLLGDIKVSTACCKTVLGYINFPAHLKKRIDRKVYIAWLNG